MGSGGGVVVVSVCMSGTHNLGVLLFVVRLRDLWKEMG